MSKKIDFDATIKKVEGISNKIDIIMRNRLIVSFFLIVDGITFLLNPNTTLPEMARNIILLILLASFSVLIANLASKIKDVKTIVISTIIIIIGIVAYIYPDFISAYMQLLLALFIIYEGATNIANALHLDIMSRFTQSITEKYYKMTSRKKASKEKQARREKFKEIDDNINEGLEQQKAKLIAPLENIVSKTSSKSSILYIIANIASIIFGVILLICPDVSVAVWGIIFLYTGLPNLFAAIKEMHLTQKIKEKKFKEIIFDTDKEDTEQQGKNVTKKSKTSQSKKKNSKPNKTNQ